MSYASKFRHPLAAAVFTALQAAAAHAQTAEKAPESQLPRISVEGQGEPEPGIKAERVASPKFTQALIDTPQTVIVVRKELIAQQGAVSLSDTLRNTPGITFQLGENGNTQSGDTIFMRGFDTQNSIFLDNIRDIGAAVRDVFNIEQVEVFKGPSGADNGRGATSGYVNLVSKIPNATDSLASSIAYGTNDRRRITGDWNHNIDAVDGAAFRINVMGQDGGVAGRDFIDQQSWAVAPGIAFGLGTDTRFYAYSQHIHQDNVPDGAIPTVGLSDYQLAITDALGVHGPLVRTANYYGLDTDFENIRANMFTFRIEHDFSDHFSFRNVSRYGKSEQERVLTAPLQGPIVTNANGSVRTDPATWTLNRTRHASFRENQVLTNQSNFTTRFRTGSIQHSVSSGVEFIYEKQYTPSYPSVPVAPTNLYNPDRNGAAVAMPTPNGVYNDGNTVTGAVYAFDTLEFTPRWQLTTGLRWEHYQTETRGASLPAAPATALIPVSLQDSDSLLSWKVGLVFKPVEIGSVYVAFANSLKPPGNDSFTLNANLTQNNNVNLPNLDPQRARNIELGTKWDLVEGRLAATAALFKSTNQNDLTRPDPGNLDFVVQYGEKEVKGVELGLVGQVTDAWELSAGLTRQDTDVKEGQFNSLQTGAAINFSPKTSATLWTTYRLPFNFTVGGGARYVATQARNIPTTPIIAGTFKVPSYHVFDLYAAYEVSENVNLQLNAYNITDEDYVAKINNSGQRYLNGIPRSYFATVNFKF